MEGAQEAFFLRRPVANDIAHECVNDGFVDGNDDVEVVF